MIGPASFSLMRGVWENAVLLLWLLDGDISSAHRIGRFKTWLADGLARTAKTFNDEVEDEIRAVLNEWDGPAQRMPTTTNFSRQYSTEARSLYRELSGIVHGRSWTVLAAMAKSWEGDGFKTGWRGFALSLQEYYSEPVI